MRILFAIILTIVLTGCNTKVYIDGDVMIITDKNIEVRTDANLEGIPK